MTNPALTREDLRALTGYSSPKKQAEWLRKELGLDPPIGADGRPRVSQAVIDQATIAKASGLPLPLAANTQTFGSGPKWTVAA